MKVWLSIYLSIHATAVSYTQNINVLTQSHIKGAIFGATLADAFSRVAIQRSDTEDLTEQITSFDNFRDEDWVYDTNKYKIGIGTENTVILLNQFESLIKGRRLSYQPQKVMEVCASSLGNILKQQETDPLVQFRKYSPKTLEELRALQKFHTCQIISDTDARALIRTIPVGLVYLDNIELAKEIADLEIQLTDRSHCTRVAAMAFTAGMVRASKDGSVEEIIDTMIKTAESCEAQFTFDPCDKCPSKYMRLGLLEAKKGSRPADIIGTRLGNTKKDGKFYGYGPAETLGSIVYCLARNNGNFKKTITDCVHGAGNNSITSTLTGALIGAKNGFWGLNKQGYQEEIEMIEKVNVMQGICNDAYIILTDH